MKTQHTFFLQSLDKSQLENLTKEVKETVSMDCNLVRRERSFGTADLWNLERNRRTRVTRRRFA